MSAGTSAVSRASADIHYSTPESSRPAKKQMMTPEEEHRYIRADEVTITENPHLPETIENPREIPASVQQTPPPETITPSANRGKKYVHPKPYKEILGYKFLKTLGQGSMGKVKLAQHFQTKEYVAVKIIPRYPKEWTSRPKKKRGQQTTPEDDEIPPEVDYDPQRDLRILRESFTLKLLDHPSIIKFLDFVMTDHHYYLIFEYVSGKPLLDYIIANGRLREDKARSVLRQIIGAVDYCHHNSIVHRDLKVENIMIEEVKTDESGIMKRLSTRRKSDGKDTMDDLQVKLLDFGLANYYHKDKLLQTFCGSLYFAAPELLHAQKYTGPEVDVWSIGVIAYVLLCGQVPFDDANLSVLHAKIKSGKISYPPFLSQSCIKFLKRLLCVNPKLRASMDEVKTHPWIQGLSDVSNGGYNSTYSLNEPPFLLSSLGDKFRYLTFGMNHPVLPPGGPTGRVDARPILRNSFAPFPLDVFLPKRVALRKLPGHHPNPVILALLKRDPFSAVQIDSEANHNQLLFSNADGSTAMPQFHGQTGFQVSQENLRKNIALKEPTTYGFSQGFGFKPEEIDDVIKAALKSPTFVDHPIISLYYLLHEWMQKHAGKPIQERIPPTNTISLPSLIHEHNLDVVPQRSDLYGTIYPRQVSEKILTNSKDSKSLQGLWSQKSPQEMCDQFYVILREEGFRYCAQGTSNNQDIHPTGFLSEWIWRPSLIVSNPDQDRYFRMIQFQVEWVQILSDEKHPGKAKYGIRCMRKAGDLELFDRVWERVKWRWEQWLSSR